jgi:MoxR-like ATPase
MTDSSWHIYQGDGTQREAIELPAAPPWRRFDASAREQRGIGFQVSKEERDMVNAALYLRRPLLITGKPGTGKSTLAYAVAHELNLGEVLRWSITTRSTLQDGLYRYDAIARLQDASLYEKQQQSSKGAAESASAPPVLPGIGKYLRLGPLGTALAASRKNRPRVLLIDEIDKSDIDLPNDLLNVFEEGEFEIPELARLTEQFAAVNIRPADDGEPESIENGMVTCEEFPVVIMTSNGEREFPPAFLRRCLQLEVPLPQKDKLAEIIKARLDLDAEELATLDAIIENFLSRRDQQMAELATDQLLNAIYLAMKGVDPVKRTEEQLMDAIFRSLSS